MNKRKFNNYISIKSRDVCHVTLVNNSINGITLVISLKCQTCLEFMLIWSFNQCFSQVQHYTLVIRSDNLSYRHSSSLSWSPQPVQTGNSRLLIQMLGHLILTEFHPLIDKLPPVGATREVTIKSVHHAKRGQFNRVYMGGGCFQVPW